MASSRGTKSLVSTVLIVLLALAAWWLQERSGDDGSSSNAETSASDTATSPTESATSPTESATSRTESATAVATEGLPEDDLSSGLPYVAVGDLPPEAADTLRLIDDGGPFPYDQDGSTFHNFEGLLPGHEDGYYREYTVETPGSEDRGARRIIGGAEGELYWTEDHYESFEVIRR